MKIGIVTIRDYLNYGNRLQNYAVYRLLKDMKCQAETLQFFCKDYKIKNTDKGIKLVIKKLIPTLGYAPLSKLMEMCRDDGLDRKRKLGFKKFSEDKMEYALKISCRKKETLSQKLEKENYSFFVAGSDQIWNPDFAGDDYYFLDFAPAEKRIALAASIGYSDLEDDVKQRYIPLLKDMKYISVREKSAAELIKKMIHKNVDVFLDPTLLVKSYEWEEIIEKPQTDIPQKYIAAFFLGEEPIEIIENFEKKTGLKTIHLNVKKYPEYYVVNPSEFLYIIKNAEYVLTDSFHGTAFSVKFNRQFFVFRREQKNMKDMFTRIEGLLHFFDLQDRNQERHNIQKFQRIDEIKWHEINMALEQQRQEFDEVFNEVLLKNR